MGCGMLNLCGPQLLVDVCPWGLGRGCKGFPCSLPLTVIRWRWILCPQRKGPVVPNLGWTHVLVLAKETKRRLCWKLLGKVFLPLLPANPHPHPLAACLQPACDQGGEDGTESARTLTTHPEMLHQLRLPSSKSTGCVATFLGNLRSEKKGECSIFISVHCTRIPGRRGKLSK